MTFADDDLVALPLADVEPEPAPRRPVALLTVAIVALLAAGGFALAYLVPASNTPEEAVRDLAAAISNEDVLGALDAIAPSERDLLKDTVVDVADELRRLGVLDEDADLSGVSGIDVELSGLELAVEPLGDGVSAVEVGADATVRFDPANLPIGPMVEDLAEGDLGEAATERERLDGIRLVTVEEGGRWYISLFYSAAEAIRREAGEPLPDFGSGVEPDGSGSPEEAVRDLVDAARGLDARRAIALLPPGEARALHDYAPLFLDDLEEAAAEARESFSLEVRRLDLDGEEDGDEAIVHVEGFAAEATADGEETSVDFDGRCFTIIEEGDEDETCGGLPLGGGIFPQVEDFELAVVTVEHGGEWYVSPIRTALRPLVEGLRRLDRQDLEDLLEDFDDLSTSRTEALEVPGSPLVAGDDETAQGNLRNALTAFKVVFTDTGAWTFDPAELAAIEPSVAIVPYGGALPMAPFVFFEIDGETIRLAARGASGCWYLADGPTAIGYAEDPDCGPPDEQEYTPEAWR